MQVRLSASRGLSNLHSRQRRTNRKSAWGQRWHHMSKEERKQFKNKNKKVESIASIVVNAIRSIIPQRRTVTTQKRI